MVLLILAGVALAVAGTPPCAESACAIFPHRMGESRLGVAAAMAVVQPCESGDGSLVGYPIRALQEFGHVVKLAGTVEEWSRALGACLEPAESSPLRVAERRNVARRYDWDDLVQVIAKTLADRLGPEYTAAFQQALPMRGESS